MTEHHHTLTERMRILAQGTKYDSCNQSAVCHAFGPDGRCIQLYKTLLTNSCAGECAYCPNRSGRNTVRATLTPEEIVKITWSFYRKNAIEGLFLSSGIIGDAENTAENMGAVFKYLPLSGFIIFLLLIIQFNSFRKMIMVYCTIPLSIIGVSVGLLAFQEPFGFMPFLGIIALAGIIINNAIVLIDRMEVEQNTLKRKEEDSIITACLQRFRPILLATFTTVLGLIPLYLTGGEMWEGMAVSIMVGLLFGTIITLIFIPSFYSILFKVDYNNYTFNEELLND